MSLAEAVDRLAWQLVAAARRTSETNLVASGLAGADLDRVLDLLPDVDAHNYAITLATLRAIVASPGVWTIH